MAKSKKDEAVTGVKMEKVGGWYGRDPNAPARLKGVARLYTIGRDDDGNFVIRDNNTLRRFR